jgi:phage terminase large subunit-like protein
VVAVLEQRPRVFADPQAVVDEYMAGVLDGTIPAARLVVAAVERQVHDLEHGEERGLTYDPDAAARVIRFFGFLRHWKGEWGPKNGKPGQVIVPEPWQAFMLAVMFGWKRRDGTRRFRQAYVEVPRKCGKTTLVSGVGLYLLMGDNEPGAEIYSFATKKEQSRIVMNDAAAFVRASESLKSRLDVSGGKYVNNISFLRMASKWEPLGADSKTQDGLNVHGGIGDELHEHRDNGMWGVIETATGARRQPMVLGITTAGSDPDSFCGQMHEYAEKLLTEYDNPDGVKNDSFFALISAAEKDDDWTDPAVWRKANPNYGVSVKPDDLADKCAKAKSIPSARNEFLRKHLNIWTDQVEAWIPVEAWDACKEPLDAALLVGRRCFGGLDLSSKLDLTAFVLMFEPTEADPKWRVLPFFWIPEATASERERLDRIPYAEWIAKGLVTPTPGNVTDYGFVEARIVELCALYAVEDVAFDPWQCVSTSNRLQDDHGIKMFEFRQGMVSMNEPCKEWERLVVSGGLAHDGNAVMRWMMGNAAVKRDEAGNIRPVKPENQHRKKIDGVVAGIMALGRGVTGETADAFDFRIV